MELGIFKDQEIIMPGVLSTQKTWREKLERKTGARSRMT